MRRLPRSVLPAAVAALAIVSVAGAFVLRARASGHARATERYEDTYYLPPPEWLRVLSLGQREALADLLWARALVYFGEEAVHRGDAEHVFNYADALLALDPDFARAYRWAGMAAMYRLGTLSVADIKRGVAYLERGARRFPDDPGLTWDLGATISYELVPKLPEGSEKQAARRRGLDFLEAAARLGAGPAWLVVANASARARLGEIDRAIRHLEEMYATVRDPDVRYQIEAHLAHLRSESLAEAVQQSTRDLDEARLRNFAYADPSLFALLGPRGVIDQGRFYRDQFAPVDVEAKTEDDLP